LSYRAPGYFLVRTISADSVFSRQSEIFGAAIISFQIPMELQGDASKLPHLLFYQPPDLKTQDWISMKPLCGGLSYFPGTRSSMVPRRQMSQVG
jgi:hypothetical protein